MNQDIERKIKRLKARRSGSDRMAALSSADQTTVLAKSLLAESGWETRAMNQPNTRYVLGCMQEVSPDYTRISLETAERVRSQLDTRLSACGLQVAFRLQGSVPANIHIRGVSDVDLLVLDTSFFTYARGGAVALTGAYRPSTKTTGTVLPSLRTSAESALRLAFPAAAVDTTGAKAINISQGSLARPVDVVPSHWHNTLDFQVSHLEEDRGVTLWDRKAQAAIDNLPFRHIAKLARQDYTAAGGLKKAIRLCKHVKADAIEEGRAIKLSSFDIASAMFYADLGALRQGQLHELVILGETRRHLDRLAIDRDFARSLLTPDGTRKIFDTEEKFGGVLALSLEIDGLARAVASEQNVLLQSLNPSWTEIAHALASSEV